MTTAKVMYKDRFLVKIVMIFSVNLILGRENYAGHDDVTLMTL